MRRVFGALSPDGTEADRARALRTIASAGDARFIAPLVDLLRFTRSTNEQPLIVPECAQAHPNGRMGTDRLNPSAQRRSDRKFTEQPPP